MHQCRGVDGEAFEILQNLASEDRTIQIPPGSRRTPLRRLIVTPGEEGDGLYVFTAFATTFFEATKLLLRIVPGSAVFQVVFNVLTLRHLARLWLVLWLLRDDE